jgi:hypothetical protein
MAQQHDWKAQAYAYVLGCTSAFRLDSLKAAIRSSNAVSRASLQRFLLETGIALSLDADLFTPTWLFFRDALCLVKPQKWEIDDGVLAPGHRLMPFHDPGLPPTRLQLVLEETGAAGAAGGADAAGDSSEGDSSDGTSSEETSSEGGLIPRRTVVAPLSRVVTYYSLFGQEALFPLLAMEDRNNAEIDAEDGRNVLVRLSVFDMGDYYHRVGFFEGDYLECRLLDWERGLFAARKRAAAEIPPRRRREWLRAMENAFQGVFEYFRGPTDIPSQLQYAYYLSDAAILEQPGGTIGELLAADNDLQFARMGSVSSTIWDAPEIPEQAFLPEGVERPLEGVTGDLDEMLLDIGLSLSSGEIEAFMRDALFHGMKEEDAVIRAFQGAYIQFAHPEQEASFQAEIRLLWETVVADYVPAGDTVTGPIRSRLLDLYEMQLQFIRDLDARGVDPGKLPFGPMNDMLQFFRMMTNAIELLNHDAGDDGEELEKLASQLPELEVIARGMLEQAESAVEANLETPDEDDEAEVFELRISLESIKPRIWRRVRVPGFMTLAHLHEIIQIVMGWTDSHLHAFNIEGEWFASDPQEIEGAAPEGRFPLSSLGLRPKDRFRYIYDFGDDWLHRILVSKILPAEEVDESDRRKPRLISGKRAAPPENCGGVPGYHRACYYLDEEEDDEEAAYWKEMLPEDWDPEYLDIKGINTRLR